MRKVRINSTKAQWSCGGHTPILQIQINQNLQQCITNPKPYPTGRTVIWHTEDELNNCSGNIFDPKDLTIGIRVIPKDKNQYYCINLVEVVLDDKRSTTYPKQPRSFLKKGDLNLP